MKPITPDPKDAAELERRRQALEFRSRKGEAAPETETIATLTVPNPLKHLTVRLRVPKLMTWRLRLGIAVITTGCWIAGVGVQVETQGAP